MSILDADRGSRQPEQYRMDSDIMTTGLRVTAKPKCMAWDQQLQLSETWLVYL